MAAPVGTLGQSWLIWPVLTPLGQLRTPKYTWPDMSDLHRLPDVSDVSDVSDRSEQSDRADQAEQSDRACQNRDKTRPGLGRDKQEQRQETDPRMHPSYAPMYIPIYIPHAPVYTTCTRVHPAPTHPRCYRGVPGLRCREAAMGLTFGNSWSCSTAIQGRVYEWLYSDYRSALKSLNRSASSSSLG